MNNTIDNRVEELTQLTLQPEVRVTQPSRSIPLAVTLTAIGFMALSISAEIVIALIGVIPGIILYGVLLIGLTNFAYFSRSSVARRMYLAFILVPLLRILSFVIPFPKIAPTFWYVMVGIPLWLSTVLVLRVNGLPSLRVDLTLADWLGQIVFGMSGIPLGVIAYINLKPPPMIINNSNWLWIVLQGIVLTIFGAVIEEIIFRGLLQKAFSYPFGFLGFILSSILYASLFIGTLSPGFILFFGLTGLLFAIWAQICDSLWGVIMAHSLMYIVFLVLFHLF